ncbi:MAG: hypothetical protein IKT58_05620 [Oscillospiraceae bacterium]|nr:hypothetical protein [Oscillospiraceae bacterium]
MMKEEYLIECPFYLASMKRAVVCEGLEKSKSLQLNFTSEKKLDAFTHCYCRTMKWDSCPLAKMLYAKYD